MWPFTRNLSICCDWLILGKITLTVQVTPSIQIHFSAAWSVTLLQLFNSFRCHLIATLARFHDTFCQPEHATASDLQKKKLYMIPQVAVMIYNFAFYQITVVLFNICCNCVKFKNQ